MKKASKAAMDVLGDGLARNFVARPFPSGSRRGRLVDTIIKTGRRISREP
jgi:hypothetical protein